MQIKKTSTLSNCGPQDKNTLFNIKVILFLE